MTPTTYVSTEIIQAIRVQPATVPSIRDWLISIGVGDFDARSGGIVFRAPGGQLVNAGHDYMLIRRADGAFEVMTNAEFVRRGYVQSYPPGEQPDERLPLPVRVPH